jgi:hypothetical protein
MVNIKEAITNITPLISAEVEYFSFNFQRKFAEKNWQTKGTVTNRN